VLGKVANLLQQNFSNLVSGAKVSNNNVNSIIPGSLLSNPQITENAAKILNKSPLEADFNEPTDHIKANPYNFGTVFYPDDVANLPTGHYMRFDIYKNNKQKFISNSPKGAGPTASERLSQARRNNELNFGTQSTAAQIARFLTQPFGTTTVGSKAEAYENATNSRQTGIQRNNNTHAFIEDSIILYTPPQVKTVYSASYADAETAGSGMIAGGNNFADFVGNSLTAVGMGARELLLQISGALPNAGDNAAALSKKTGTAKNPNLEMVFKSVPFRKFEYNFEFSPRNQSEVNSTDKILKLFRYHMQPGLNNGSSAFFVVPSEFEITYMYIDKQNSYIPKIARCVLTDMTIDQSPEGVFTTFKSDENGAFPTATKVTLAFTETEIMTKQKVAGGF
jgi:hypothetical protein